MNKILALFTDVKVGEIWEMDNDGNPFSESPKRFEIIKVVGKWIMFKNLKNNSEYTSDKTSLKATMHRVKS